VVQLTRSNLFERSTANAGNRHIVAQTGNRESNTSAVAFEVTSLAVTPLVANHHFSTDKSKRQQCEPDLGNITYQCYILTVKVLISSEQSRKESLLTFIR
jgi:hypothetical protein